MTKKWIAINLLLLAVTGLLGWRLHNSVLQFHAANDLSKIQPVKDIKQKMPQEPVILKPAPNKTYNPAEFAVIADKNIFSDTRSKEQKAEAVAPPEPPPLAQKPILVGITISGDQQLASIIDPASPPPNRRAQIKRIGDSYSGYVITEITMDRIVLQNGTRREIIPLHEGTKRSQPGKTPVLATRVFSFGGGAATGGTSAAVVSGPASSTPVRPATSVGSVTPVSSPAPKPAPAAVAPQPQTPPRTRVIKTPFGDVIRSEE
jgi:hypothetical protein